MSASRGAGILACVTILLPLAQSPARADVVHLKNGGTIAADSWEVRGDVLLIRQGSGRIAVPRADIESIEAVAPAAPGVGTPADPSGAAARPSPSPAAPRGDAATMTDEDMERAIEVLRRRINDYPLARAENTRRLVFLLDQLGGRAFKAREDDAALARFREALGYDEHDASAQLGLAAVYLRRDNDIFARSTLEQALLDHPDNAAMHSLLGDAYNGEERTEEALREWQKADELKPDTSLRAKIDKLGREHTIDGNYRQSEAAHFTLKYDGGRGGPDLGGQIQDYLESEFKSLETRFEYYPLQPIIVIVYPQKQFYEATQADANVAGLYDGKIRVPIGGLQQVNAEARHVLLHEMAHAFIAGKSRGTAPRWLHEGLAQQIEGKTTHAATGTAFARAFRSLEDKSTWGQEFSYPTSLAFVEWLIDRVGFPAIVDVLKTMGEGGPPDAAFEQVTRYSLGELRQAWGESLVAKYLQ